jgi:hypothetical protein
MVDNDLSGIPCTRPGHTINGVGGSDQGLYLEDGEDHRALKR